MVNNGCSHFAASGRNQVESAFSRIGNQLLNFLLESGAAASAGSAAGQADGKSGRFYNHKAHKYQRKRRGAEVFIIHSQTESYIILHQHFLHGKNCYRDNQPQAHHNRRGMENYLKPRSTPFAQLFKRVGHYQKRQDNQYHIQAENTVYQI